MNMKTTLSGESIAHYYDRNTIHFLRMGGSGDTEAIHRQIWAPGIKSRQAAFIYLNQLVLEIISPVLKPKSAILDLGCGVGGTTTWIAQQTDAKLIGISNSPLQVRIAQQRSKELGLDNHCSYILADFQDLPLSSFRAAYAIESYSHARDGFTTLQNVASRMGSGGRLVICDDFLSPSIRDQISTDRARQAISALKQGWHLPSLDTEICLIDHAIRAGLFHIKTIDLTPFVRYPSPLLVELFRQLTRFPIQAAYWNNLSGGAALQICIKNGWTKYQAVVFEKM